MSEKPVVTLVFNLLTGDEKTYTLSSREAVMAAYAQEHKDFNTWDYEERYGHLTLEGNSSISCGDWTALKEDH